MSEATDRLQEIRDRLAGEGHGWGSWRGIAQELVDLLDAEYVHAELCARCTPERDHNGVLCRGCANARVAALEKALMEIAEASYMADWRYGSQEIASEALAGRPGSDV